MAMMNIRACLKALGLSETEVAELLTVDPRTIRRWVANPNEIPGPARQALNAWMRLNALGMAWRPDGIDFYQGKPITADQIAAYRNHSIKLDQLIEKVRLNGGPAAPWIVDLKKRRATLGGLQISFYALQNGGFSPQSYTRRDKDPDMVRDASLIEDGYAAIADAIAKAGVNWANK